MEVVKVKRNKGQTPKLSFGSALKKNVIILIIININIIIV